jgi:MGT family glycosyltransferase
VPRLEFFPGLYRAALDALADLPVRVLVTVGEARDPDALGPLPPSVRVERWVPQAAVMPHAAAMVGHGGSGSTLAALAAGVPVALVPLFADQAYNARRVAELGAGIALTGGQPALSGLGPAVRALLEDPRHRAAAARLAGEVRALTPVDAAVQALAQSVAERALAA